MATLRADRFKQLQKTSKIKKRYTILVVDDEESNLNAIAMILDESYNVLKARDGKEALELLSNLPNPEEIHCIVTDQRMSEMNGVEFLKQTIPFIPQTIRILLTGFTDIEAMIASINDAQVYQYLTKPIEANDLEITIRRGLESYELKRKNFQLLKELQAFHASLEKTIKERTYELQEALDTIEEDLITAGEIQKYIFPLHTPPPFLKIAIRYVPLAYVSGDIYYFSSRHKDVFDTFIGDATGHGVRAALCTIMLYMLLLDAEKSSIPQIMEYLDENLEKLLPDDRFITGLYVRIDSSGKLTYTLAGHPPAIILSENGEEITFSSQGIGPLGTFVDNEYVESSYQLKPGDRIFIFTDGIIEVWNKEYKTFGLPMVSAFLKKNNSMDLEEILDALLDRLQEHRDGQNMYDDLTIIAFQYY